MALACREDRAMLEKSLKRLAGFCKKVRGKGGCRLPFFLFGELKRLIPGFGAEPQGSILMWMEDEWLPGIEGLLRRLDEIPREKVREALKELGDPNSDNYWQKIDGAYYHQLPDLLLAWDFTYDLTVGQGNMRRQRGVFCC
jgi:hypothetical protein